VGRILMTDTRPRAFQTLAEALEELNRLHSPPKDLNRLSLTQKRPVAGFEGRPVLTAPSSQTAVSGLRDRD